MLAGGQERERGKWGRGRGIRKNDKEEGQGRTERVEHGYNTSS